MNLSKIFKQNKWRLKAKRYSKEKNALEKRIKELEISRNKHKNKYNELKEKYNKLEDKKKEIETELKKN